MNNPYRNYEIQMSPYKLQFVITKVLHESTNLPKKNEARIEFLGLEVKQS